MALVEPPRVAPNSKATAVPPRGLQVCVSGASDGQTVPASLRLSMCVCGAGEGSQE